jgi:CubicO group peptidase (beta-lactamase class C family)
MAIETSLIRNALERAVELGEIGVAVAVYAGEDCVVDECIGDVAPGDAPVQPDTLFPVFSVTKAMVATSVHIQAERGLLDYEAPVAEYWPEFAQQGKGDITVRHVLCHQSGMAAMPPDITPARINDWDWVTGQLAAMAPLHPPGEANAYHALSFGWLLGEVVRRTDPQGRVPCRFVPEEILDPCAVPDVWLTTPVELDDRVAILTTAGAAQRDFSAATLRTASTPPAVAPSPEVYNLPEMRHACNPAAGAVAAAHGIARFFAILANGGSLGGVRLLSEDRVRACLEVRPGNHRLDEVAGETTDVGRGGFWVLDPDPELEPSPNALPESIFAGGTRVLYQTGAGGSLGWADLDARVAVGICHNRMFGPAPAERHPWAALGDAIATVLAGRDGA